MSRLPRLRGALLSALAAWSWSVDGGPSVATQPPTIPTTVTIAWLYERARGRDPAALIAAAGRGRASALADQAGRWDDPALAIEAGRRDSPDGDASRLRVAVVQSVPWGGARGQAAQAALAGVAVADAEAALALADLVADLRGAAVTLLAAERRQALADEALAAATAVRDAVDRLVAANRAGEIDRLRATVEVAEAEQQVESAGQRSATARRALALRTGVDLPPAITIDLGLRLPGERAALAEVIARHPAQLASAQRIAAARATLAAAQAARRPDVDVGLFGERDGDSDEVGLSLSIAIPAWNGNRAGVAVALADLRVAEAVAARAQRDLRLAAEQAWDDWLLAERRAAIIQRTSLPAAERALALLTAAYGRGQGALTDLLDARRTLVRLRAEVAAASAEADSARSGLERAFGRSLENKP